MDLKCPQALKSFRAAVMKFLDSRLWTADKITLDAVHVTYYTRRDVRFRKQRDLIQFKALLLQNSICQLLLSHGLQWR